MAFEFRKPGDMIEGYRVLKELGRGAASVIYVVQDLKTKQVWALKHVAKTDEKSIRFIEQAEQEYQIASKLNNDKVRRIEKCIKKKESLLGGVSELFLLMEHVDGASCEVLRPKTFEQAVAVFEQVAHGLSYMHSKGFVHADMKPNNIIVDDLGNAKVIDLGQSCKIGTVKQRIQGTPDFIAPEQVHRRAITPKTDVYNLGAALYWIFTRAYIPTALAKGDSLLGSIDDSLLQKPKRPIELNTRVPEMLDKIIMDCVEVDPDARPTMEQVADRLNLIRSRLIADQELKKSGSAQGNIDSGGTKGGTRGGGSGIGPSLGDSRVSNGSRSSSRSGKSSASASKPLKSVPPPPIDPGPGIEDADAENLNFDDLSDTPLPPITNR